MKISRHIEHRLNTGEYSAITIGATVELDSEEYEDTITPTELINEANELAEVAIQDDLAEAKRVTDPDMNHIHEWGA